tara:strand:- start:1573 stop:1878 length:306 start_codon:yes stop_codon:yes gene_type:complete
MPGHPEKYNMKNKDLAASAKYGTPMQKNYGAGPKMYNSPADMHPGHPAKMSGKHPEPPMEPGTGAPGKFTAELVKEANDPNSGMNDKFKAIVKKAGSKDKS